MTSKKDPVGSFYKPRHMSRERRVTNDRRFRDRAFRHFSVGSAARDRVLREPLCMLCSRQSRLAVHRVLLLGVQMVSFVEDMSGPKHPAYRRLVGCNFFRDLESFGQLEERIDALPTPQERGNAFEVFVEAYLATQRSIAARVVLPFDQIPREVRTKRSLDTVRDMGVDGVYETNLGGLNAYQAKFRSGRPALRWEELATFMGLTEQVDERVLLYELQRSTCLNE